MSEAGSSSMPASRKSQRRKNLTIKAQENYVAKKLFYTEDSASDIYAESSSEFNSQSESSSSDTSEEASDISELESETSKNLDDSVSKILLPKKRESKKKPKNKSGRLKTTQSYTIKAEDYFYNHSQKKNHTSNHTLDKLKTPRLSQEELQKLLTNMTINEKHNKCIREMYNQYKNHFDKWICHLHEGFNVLLYGLGSKRNILNDFHKEYLSNMPVIVVNGFFPSLTIKEIIDAIMVDILDTKEVPSNLFEATEIISHEFQQYPNLHLYLIIHNIEGETLHSNSKGQSLLANLASIDNIHLITSIDHINTPLIWDQNKLSKFNFTWWDVTTFLPYKEETSFETSMMITKSGSLALSSLRNVFLSLTSNSKGIYLLIVKYQIENTSKYYQGMLFKDLYLACRDAFLVSSDLALRAQLTEFVDHKMVKFRRSHDGAEHLIIPIPNNLLQEFLNNQ